MAQLIDSSIFIALDRAGASLDEFITFMGDEPFAMASITASELLVGAYRTVDTAQQLRRLEFIEAVISQVPPLAFDLDSARMHARLFADLSSVGQMIGANDLIIAATALTHGYAVMTHNLRHFHRVPGLVVNAPAW